MRAVIYARYSSELQRDASIEDQVRLCKARIDAEKWVSVGIYTDHAMSGSIRMRPATRNSSRMPVRAPSTSSSPRRSIAYHVIKKI